jgi:hypothetical protein
MELEGLELVATVLGGVELAHYQLAGLNFNFTEYCGDFLSSVRYFKRVGDVLGLSVALHKGLQRTKKIRRRYSALLSGEAHGKKKYTHIVRGDIEHNLAFVLLFIDKLQAVNTKLCVHGIINGSERRTGLRSGSRRPGDTVPLQDLDIEELVEPLLCGQSTSSCTFSLYGHSFVQVASDTSPEYVWEDELEIPSDADVGASTEQPVSANNSGVVGTMSGTGISEQVMNIPKEPNPDEISTEEETSDGDEEAIAEYMLNDPDSFGPAPCATVVSDGVSTVPSISSSSVAERAPVIDCKMSPSLLSNPVDNILYIMNIFICMYSVDTVKRYSSEALPCRKSSTPRTYLYHPQANLSLPQCWSKPYVRIDKYEEGNSELDSVFRKFRSVCFSCSTANHESYCIDLLLSCLGADRECSFDHYWPIGTKSNQYSWPCGCVKPCVRELPTDIPLSDNHLLYKAWVTAKGKSYRYLATRLCKKRKAARRNGRRLRMTDGKKYNRG